MIEFNLNASLIRSIYTIHLQSSDMAHYVKAKNFSLVKDDSTWNVFTCFELQFKRIQLKFIITAREIWYDHNHL